MIIEEKCSKFCWSRSSINRMKEELSDFLGIILKTLQDSP